MAQTSTLLRPPELPPFELRTLVEHDKVFTPPSSPNPESSSSNQHPSNTGSRFVGGLASLVGGSAHPSAHQAQVGETSGAASASGRSHRSTPSQSLGKGASIRSFDCSPRDERIYVGSSDGRVRVWKVVGRSGSGAGAGAGVGLTGSEKGKEVDKSQLVEEGDGFEQEDEAPDLCQLAAENLLSSARRAIERIAILPAIDKAIVLSEGLLTYYTLSTLSPLAGPTFPPVRGVSTFVFEEPRPNEDVGVTKICIFKRRGMQMFRVAREGVAVLQELAMPDKCHIILGRMRAGRLCIASTHGYALVQLDQAKLDWLIPISQDAPDPSAPAGSEPSPKSYQRPTVLCVGKNEFLVASHTGDSAIGIFLEDSGAPSQRGTIEWSSNPRSVVVDYPYVVALLRNNSIEVHSLHTQEIVQVLRVEEGLDARTLSAVIGGNGGNTGFGGLKIGAAAGEAKIRQIPFRFFEPSSLDEPRMWSLASSNSISSAKSSRVEEATTTRTVVICRNALLCLTPLTLVAQAEAFMESNRVDDAVNLARQVDVGNELDLKPPEIRYVYQRAAFTYLFDLKFEEAGKLFHRGQIDPRILVKMFPDLQGSLIQTDTVVEIFAGVEEYVREGQSVEDMVVQNLRRNYSPHIKPDVETGSPTSELMAVLVFNAREMLRVFLGRWWKKEMDRGPIKGHTDEAAALHTVVDTVLVKLSAETGDVPVMLNILETSPYCLISEIEPFLLKQGLEWELAQIAYSRGDATRALELWTSLVDRGSEDPRLENIETRIADEAKRSSNGQVAHRYGFWLLARNSRLGVQVLAQAAPEKGLDPLRVLEELEGKDRNSAELFLETVVLQKKASDPSLQARLIDWYLARLESLLTDKRGKIYIASHNSAFAAFSKQHPETAFLPYFVSRTDLTDVDLYRLRLILILHCSSLPDHAYVETRSRLEHFPELMFERAVILGKLSQHREALNLLVCDLSDLLSAETYCAREGDLLSSTSIDIVAKKSGLPPPLAKPKRIKRPKAERELARRVNMKMLVEISLGQNKLRRPLGYEQTTKLLNAQAVHLDTLEILHIVSSEWPLASMSTFLSRSLRRSLHTRHEAVVRKGLCLAQNLETSERLFDMQRKAGGVVAEKVDGDSADDSGQSEEVQLGEKIIVKERETESPDPEKNGVDVVELRL